MQSRIRMSGEKILSYKRVIFTCSFSQKLNSFSLKSLHQASCRGEGGMLLKYFIFSTILSLLGINFEALYGRR